MSVQTPIKHADLTVEQVTDIKKLVLYKAQAEQYFEKFCDVQKWQEGYVSMQYRRLIYPTVKPEDVIPATEGVAPRPTKIAYASFNASVENYREKATYTAEAVKYNIDNVVKDTGETLAYLMTKKLDYIKGNAFISSRATLSPVLNADGTTANISKTLRKANIILSKNEAKKWAGGNWLAISTPEVIELFRDELEANGSTLDEGTKIKLQTGEELPVRKGFAFSECPSDLFHDGEGNHYLVLMGRTFEGKSPITVYSMNGLEVIHNPLGSGVLLDADGNVTADDNHQIGSIAMNVMGLSAVVTDDMCVLVCKIPASTIDGTDLRSDQRTNYVAKSPTTSELTFDVIDSTGSAVAGTTITVKVGSSTGSAVSPSSGVYTLDVEKKYYYSVAKSGYTPVTGFVTANPTNKELVITLPTA